MKKRLLIIVTLLAVLLFTSQSFSAPKWQIKDFKGRVGNMTITVDGRLMYPRVEPFVLVDQGVTMVPLRDLSEALGFTVNWDEKTGSIQIVSPKGSAETANSDHYWVGKSRTKIEAIKVLRNVGPFFSRQSKYQIAGRDFSSGIAVNLGAGNDAAETVLDLNQRYSTLEGFFGVDDATMNSRSGYILTIYGDDRLLFTSEVAKPADYPTKLAAGELDLRYVNKLTIMLETRELPIGDYPDVRPVLADFYLFGK